MTAPAAAVTATGAPSLGGSRLGWVLADALTITKRNLIALTRNPEAVFFSSAQPIMFVLLFRYVFGGAIHPLHGSYVNFLMPGIFVQTVAFGSVGTSIGLAEDLNKGLIERFRALPMARSAVLAGRTMADFVRNVFVLVLMVAVGYAVGFRVQTDASAFLAGCAMVLLFSYAMSWGFATIGLSAPNSETAQVMAFPILFPFVFASPAFVPVVYMPGWLQAFANHQPFAYVVLAARALMVGGPTAQVTVDALAWCGGILVVLVPLAVWRYRRVG
jgi:ABC-2 type transport system permease protein/oleandomycin transport system permease protein